MDQRAMESFKVIGLCNKMQTTSWDQEISLLDGVPYDINFFRDFSQLYLDGLRIVDIPVLAIIQAIDIQPDRISENSAMSDPSGEGHRESQKFCEWFEKYEKDERKREKKWKKRHPKPKSQKEAERYLEYLVDNIMEG